MSSEAWAKLREWAILAGKGRLLLSGSVVLASLKAAVQGDSGDRTHGFDREFPGLVGSYRSDLLPKQGGGTSQLSQIKVNPTQVSDHQSHPVKVSFCLTLSLALTYPRSSSRSTET